MQPPPYPPQYRPPPSKKSNSPLILALVGLGLFGMCSAAIKSKREKVEKRAATLQSSVSVSPAANAKPNSPLEALEFIARERLDKRLTTATLEALDATPADGGVDAKRLQHKYRAKVGYDIGAVWSENTLVSGATSELARLAPKVFEIDGVEEFELEGSTEFKDVYGKSTNSVATRFTISRQTSEKIEWSTFDRRNLPIVFSDDDSIYVHPALRKAWIKYTSKADD